MPFAHRGDTSIYYEKTGTGFPIIAIAPGGLRSAISFWEKAKWDLTRYFTDDLTVITLDLRTAGNSTTVIHATDGWKELEEDIIAVLDDAQIEQAHCMGMCIGGAFVIGLLEHYPQRFIAGVPIQPIGLHNNLPIFQAGWNDWKKDYLEEHPQADAEAVQQFTENLLQSDFLFNGVTREEVSLLPNPLLILEGDDEYHPREISQELAELVPNAELITDWKTNIVGAQESIKKFLIEHTPS